MPYHGVIIGQSLSDNDLIREFDLLATRRGKAWTFYLVSIQEERFERQIHILQANMAHDDYWYAHFFKDEELVVVFRDASFTVSTNPATWDSVVDHGIRHGIPANELDFNPRTMEGARAFFGLDQNRPTPSLE